MRDMVSWSIIWECENSEISWNKKIPRFREVVFCNFDFQTKIDRNVLNLGLCANKFLYKISLLCAALVMLACDSENSFEVFEEKVEKEFFSSRFTLRAQSRPISDTFHILLGYEADARMQNRYDVRIYSSSGNRVRQVIAEGDRVKFDLNDLPNGTYYLHICDGVGEPVIQLLWLRIELIF